MLKPILLGILQYQPMTGYELERFISTSAAHFWNAKLSQIYRSLKQMEEAGWVISHVEEQDDRPNRRVYEVTETGRAEFTRWQNELVTELDDNKQPFLARLFFYGRRPLDDVATQLKIWHDLYSKTHYHFQHQLPQEIEALKNDMPFYRPEDEIFWEAVRTLGERLNGTIAEWLEETITAVEAIEATKDEQSN